VLDAVAAGTAGVLVAVGCSAQDRAAPIAEDVLRSVRGAFC
jgi:hypothetical protein